MLTAWGRGGRMAGQFKWVHNIGIDSKGNLYTAEVGFGRRAQKSAGWIESDRMIWPIRSRRLVEAVGSEGKAS